MESPFRIDQVFDTDIDFAAKGTAVWGPHIEYWRQEQTAILHRAMWALQPLTNRILKILPEVVPRVTASRRPAHIALATTVLRWPDRTQAQRYVQGFPIIEEVERSNVVRPTATSDTETARARVVREFFGQPAIDAVDAIEASPPAEACRSHLASRDGDHR